MQEDDELVAPDDVGADVRAAYDELSTAADKPAPEAKPRDDGRDDKGRFAAKPEDKPESAPVEAAAQTPNPEEPAKEPEAQAGAILPPRSWTPAAKAKFLTLDPDIQQEVLKREGDMEKGAAEWQTKAQKLKAIDDVVAPYREMLALNGTNEVQALGYLLNAQKIMTENPVGAIKHFMKQYGVTPQHLMDGQQQPAPQGGQPVQGLDPRLVQHIQDLTQRVYGRDEQEQLQATASAQKMIEDFASDPKHMYFENVRDDMTILIQAGKASDLETAYDMAIWARKDTRELLQKQAAIDVEQKAQAAKHAEAARKASGSLQGAPGRGAAPKSNPVTDGKSHSQDVDADVRAAYKELSA